MDCDIHLHVEIKVSDRWEHYTHRRLDRDYRLFSKMAGVPGNGEIKPLAPIRGLPSDITTPTRLNFIFWEDIQHSASWLSSEEITELICWHNLTVPFANNLNQQLGYLFENGYENFLDSPKCYPDKLKNFRWIFWFDN